MKRIHIVLLALFMVLFQMAGQSQCVNCQGSTVTGTNASGIGSSPTALGNSSFAGGSQSQSRGSYSFAFGNQAISGVEGNSAVAMGMVVESNGPASFTLGRFLKANAGAAFVFGSGYGSSGYLVNAIPSSLMIGFNSTVPTFFVSNSFSSTLTGKIGIGNITSPTAKLHLLSDAGEAAELKLEHRTTGLRQYSEIYLGTHTIRAGNAENMVFTTPAGKNFAFEEGKVGVGTTDPGSKFQVTGGDVFVEDINSGIIMKSPDGRCWRGTMTNEGVMAFAETPCPSGSGYVAQPAEPETLGIRIYPNPSGGRFTIESSGPLNNAIVSIFTADGKLLMEYNLGGSSKLQTDGFASGTYVVTITANGRTLKSQ